MRASAPVDTAAIGDPFLLGDEFREMSRGDVARTFGEGFAEQLSAVTPAAGRGRSRRASARISSSSTNARTGGLPPLATVRDAVRREWQNAQQIEAEQKLYQSLRDRYEIVVETPPTAAAENAR